MRVTQNNRSVVVAGDNVSYRKTYRTAEGAYRAALRIEKKLLLLTDRYANADAVKQWAGAKP